MLKIKFTSHYEVDAANGAKYQAGEVVSVPGASAKHFVNRGVAVYWTGKKKKAPRPSSEDRRIKPDYESQPEAATDPKAVGGGMYELPDGTKVRGKKAADSAMAKMKVGKTVPEPDRAAIAKRTLPDG